jgi:hypothetical protein
MKRAEALLHDVGTLEIGRATVQDVQRVVKMYGGEPWGVASGFCKSADTGSVITVTNKHLNWSAMKNRILRPFGNRFWSVEVVFLSSEGRLCAVLYLLRALRSEGLWEISVKVYRQQEIPSPDYRLLVPSRYSARVFKNFLDFKTEMTPSAPARQHQHSTDFALSWLMRLWGCREPCELLPTAWRDYQTAAEKEGLTPHTDELNDPRCGKV